MVFAFKQGARIKANPQIAGEICKQLEESGGLTPKRLLDVSRDNDAPLHDEFEWDDSIAAETYREQQAAHIIRCIIVKEEKISPVPIRAFFSVTNNREYTSTEVILKTPSLRETLMEQAKKEMVLFKDKYETLSELEPIFFAIDNILEKIA